MNIELSKLEREGSETWATAKVSFIYDRPSELRGQELVCPEENILVEFCYSRAKGELDINHFEVFHRSKYFDEHFNSMAFLRFKRAIVAFCETATAANIYV
ncbi:TPA: hypothetical protein ACLMX1_000269 [Pseudomonas aeruginosa]|uniref:hypothetical protein n=1 Tax=Pseudomonas TaxID=286 RepID=UPI0012AE9160|nr:MULTISPECIES: hypothetical protein [Pseudomonas]MBH3381225.1 hypothetical protein [Pseudomonas asiatica]MBS6037565.1 hypothetical protein [Pseudomonas sp.]MRT59940.1 hypothetical protein [Pseudomonas sp. CAH-1]